MKSYHFFSIFCLAILLVFLSNQVLLSQTSHFVTNGGDSGPGSLRQVLSDAGSGDTIKFLEGIDSVFLMSDELLINKSIVILGRPGHTSITKLDTVPKFRIFRVRSEDSLVVEFLNLNIRFGHAPDGSDAYIHGQHGGGIFVPDSIHELILRDCLINENYAGEGYRNYSVTITGNGGSGGGIYSLSSLRLYDCQVNSNAAGNGAGALSGGDWHAQHAGSGGSGGGIYCLNDLLLENCIINQNKSGSGGDAFGTTYSSGSNGGAGGSGGAVYGKSGTISIMSTEIMNNSSGKGGNASNSQSSCSGGIAGNGGALCLSESSVTISYSEITGNHSGNGGSGSGNESGHGKNGGNGGGIYVINCQLSVGLTDIEENHTGSGGYSGGYTYYVSPGSGGNGGGIYAENTYFISDDCNIAGNITGDGASASYFYSGGGHGGSGGGIYILNSDDGSKITNCRIENNHAGHGGTFNDIEIYTHTPVANGGHGGGMSVTNSSIKIINCLISGNNCGNAVFKTSIPPGGDYSLPKAGCGGGIFISQSVHQIINSTISGNTAGTAIIVAAPEKESTIVPDSVRGQGGGIFPSGDTVQIINSIIAKNYLGFDNLMNDIEGPCNLNYSLISSDTLAEYSGTGNLVNIDPHFIDFPDSLSLAPTSFAINSGSPDTTGLLLPLTDLAGNPRVYGERIDMGAYEFQGEPQYQYIISPDEKDIHLVIYPNPFSRETRIFFTLRESDDVNLNIYNSRGIKVDEITLKNQQAGENYYIWKRKDLPAGMYFYDLIFGKNTASGKFIIVD